MVVRNNFYFFQTHELRISCAWAVTVSELKFWIRAILLICFGEQVPRQFSSLLIFCCDFHYDIVLLNGCLSWIRRKMVPEPCNFFRLMWFSFFTFSYSVMINVLQLIVEWSLFGFVRFAFLLNRRGMEAVWSLMVPALTWNGCQQFHWCPCTFRLNLLNLTWEVGAYLVTTLIII